MSDMTEYGDNRERLTDKVIGHCGVDSGTLMIVDPCYVDEGFDYQAYCEALGDFNHPIEWAGGVALGTMYGDGTYPVHGMVDSKGRVHAIYVNLGDEPVDPDDEEDWDAPEEDEDES